MFYVYYIYIHILKIRYTYKYKKHIYWNFLDKLNAKGFVNKISIVFFGKKIIVAHICRKKLFIEMCLVLSILFFANIYLTGAIIVQWYHVPFGIIVSSLGKSFHLMRYLSVNGNTSCPVIKRDKVDCALEECAMLFCGDPLNKVLAVRMRMLGASLRFPCATIFLHKCTKYFILTIKKYIHYH